MVAELLARPTSPARARRSGRSAAGRTRWCRLRPPSLPAQDAAEAAAAQAYLRYDDTLRAYQAVDFDDLIALPIALLEARPASAARWRERCAQLSRRRVPGHQSAQYRLLRTLAGEAARFTAVGDDDQAIYGWRGASLDNLAQLRATTRSSGGQARAELPLDGAHPALGQRADREQPEALRQELWSEHGAGDAIRVTPAADDEAEAEGVVHRILAHKFEHRGRYADYAVLYRGNHQAKLFEQQLRAQNVPYTISGGQSYFERAEIKDLVAYLRLIANDDDDPRSSAR